MPPVELDAAFELLKILARQPQLHGKHLYRQEVGKKLVGIYRVTSVNRQLVTNYIYR